MRVLSQLLLATVLSGAVSVAGRAQVATFDDLPANFSPVPSNYVGLTWQDFGVIANSGSYGVHASSGANYGYAYCCSYHPVISSASPFDFTSAYLSTLQNFPFTWTINGYDGSTLLYTALVATDATPALHNFNFNGVTSVEFVNSYSANLALDDVTFNASTVPEPGSIFLLTTGLGALGGLGTLRRRRQQAT